MVAFLVVLEHPGPGEFTHLLEVAEQPGVEQLLTIRAIESFDVGVLIGFPRLDIVNDDAVLLAPVDEGITKELWPVVGTQHIRQSALAFYLLEHPYQTLAW